MIRQFLNHEWKRIRRSPEFHRNVGAKIFWGFLIGILMLEVLVFGIMMGVILREERPGEDPVTVFNGFLLLYFSADIVMRIMGQKLQTMSARPYLILPIPRLRVVEYQMLRTQMTLFNAFPLLMFLPVSIVVVGANAGVLSALSWILALLLGMGTNCFIAAMLKTRILNAPRRAVLPIVLLFIVVGLQYSGLVRLNEYSSAVFDAPVRQPWFLLVPLALFAATSLLTARFFESTLRMGNAEGPARERPAVDDVPLLKRFGLVGRIIMLDIKMLFRNRRTKPTVVLSALLILYGLLVYPSEPEIPNLLALLVGIFVTGTLALSYGSFTFSWESRAFGVYTTRPLDWTMWLRAKYIFMVIMVTASFLVSTFYIFFGWKVVMFHAVASLFNIGVTVPLMLWLSTFSRVRFDLDANAMSAQGKTGIHYSALFLVFALLLLFYFPGWILWNADVGTAFVAGAGLTGIVMRESLIRMVSRRAKGKKYVMVAGFRQS